MSLSRHFRDPVHGFIELEQKEVALVGTLTFQRLRRIRQLAMAHLAFHGASHTRFDHCLGVCHVAGRMASVLLSDGESIRLTRLAALVHDLGHGPFSHAFEGALAILGAAGMAQVKSEKLHEEVTRSILRHDPAICPEILGQRERDMIVELLEPGRRGDLCSSIVSGPLDADKMDYLLRDSYYCGVRYGLYDIDQLLRCLTALENAVAVNENGVPALEQFVLAKYYLNKQVYRHKVRRISDEMLTRGILLGIQETKHPFLLNLMEFEDSPGYVERYLDADDGRLLWECTEGEKAGGKSQEVFRRLRDRDLYKVAFDEPLREVSEQEGLTEQQRETLSRICDPNRREERKTLEGALADEMSSELGEDMDPASVIAHAYSFRNPWQREADEGPVMVATSPPREFEEVSQLFGPIREGEQVIMLGIYCPLKYDTKPKKQEIRERIGVRVRSVLCAFGRE